MVFVCFSDRFLAPGFIRVIYCLYVQKLSHTKLRFYSGHARSPRAPTDAPDTSSAMSTLSSYTSSSASEDTFSETSPRAKLVF